MGAGPDAGRELSGTRSIGGLLAVGISLATAIVLVAAAVLVLMTPLYMHGALQRAGSPAILGLSATEATAISDATVVELILGPGTFAMPLGSSGERFYDPSEASHLRDARTIFGGLMALAGLSLLVLGIALARSRRVARMWRAVAAGAGGLVVAFIAIGLAFLLAFDQAFTLFHQIFFPGGNWAFDISTQRMVQLYPIRFWQEATMALGVLVVIGGSIVWWVARQRANRLTETRPGDAVAEVRPTPEAT